MSSHSTLPVVTLNRKAGQRFLHGHPWVFSNELQKPAERPARGAIVRLQGHDGRFLAYGFYHPNSLIAFRCLSRDPAKLPDADFLQQLLAQALALREQLFTPRQPQRLVHSESDGLPGLIIDRYNDVLSVQVNAAGMEQRLDGLLEYLQARLAPREIVLRNDSALRELEGLERYQRCWQSDCEQVIASVTEHDLTYAVDVLHGQKTGAFIDQRDNRVAWQRYVQPGDRVLDAFCNDGGFAMHAARAGSQEVLAVDISATAIERARDNARENALDGRITFEKHDVMRWLPEFDCPQAFDVINLDPPAFAANRKAVPAALNAYRKLHAAAMRVLKPGGILATACCSHHVSEEAFADAIQQAAVRNRRQCQVLLRGSHSADHPVLLAMPESSYLKFLVMRVI